MTDDSTPPSLAAVNLNHLVVFDGVFRTGSVSGAARELGLTQSGASNVLAQLRLWYGDPLFVRSGNLMIPTERATEIAPQVAAGLESLRRALAPTSFDPATLTRTIALAMPDYAQHVLLRFVARRLAEAAPRARLVVRTVARHGPPVDLARGRLDAYVGFVEQLSEEHVAERLYDDEFVLLLRAAHPAAAQAGAPSRKTWLRHGHVVVSSESIRPTAVDRTLADLGLERRIAAVVESASMVPDLLVATDWVAAVGRSWGEVAAARSQGTLVTRNCPIHLPRGRIRVVVHRRVDGEPMSRWIRGLLHAAAADANVG